MDPTAMSANLMKDPKFMEMFQRALGDGKIPDEKDPNRDKWLKDMQSKLASEAQKEAKKQLEQPVSDKDGQWMYVIPEPGFCIKCSTSAGHKVFINICKHERIAEPIPLEPEEQEEEDAIKFKIPLSCGQARPDKDKSGQPCKVYDVIVNPNTLQRCSDDNEFRRFVAALCMTWIKQKSEPGLNADEFKNLNFKCKGVPEAQRIRLSTAQKPANAMGDEIELPSTGGATLPVQAGGRDKPLVQEIVPPSSSSSSTTGPAAAPTPSFAIRSEGVYDWGRHSKAAKHPNFRDNVPKEFHLTITVPGVTTIREVDVQVVRGRSVELTYVDEEQGKPFLQIPLEFHVSEEPVSAKFVKSKNELRLVLGVSLPDESDEVVKTKPSRDVTEIEEEERRAAEKEQERKLQEQRERYDRLQKQEQEVMNQRKEYVDNITALQEGTIPPAIREEFDGMNAEQQRTILMRIEQKVRRGDSVDELLDKMSEEILAAICRYLRSKLGLEQLPPPAAAAAPKKAKQLSFDTTAAPSSSEKKDQPKAATSASSKENVWEQSLSDQESTASVEYNFAKKAEKLFGVLMNNRYVFALDH